MIATLNMKGGVGKTTVTAHLPRELYRRLKLKSLLIDLDAQFNLSQAILPESEYEKLLVARRTILAAMESGPDPGLLDISLDDGDPPKPEDLAHVLRRLNDSTASLSLIVGDFMLWKYSVVSDANKLRAARERFLRFISSARGAYDSVWIDCNPSSSFITLCALHACTHVLVPVRPDRYSMLGLKNLSLLINSIHSIKPKPRLIILLNGLSRSNPSSTERDVESQIRSHPEFGAFVLAHSLPHSSLLHAHTGYTGFATDKKVAHTKSLQRRLIALSDELAPLLGVSNAS